MSQARRPADDERATDGRQKRQDVCSYIFDLLGSLESIAAQNDLPVLARLIATAKSEAQDCR